MNSWKTLNWASLVVQLVKNPPAMRETWVQSLGWEDSLEKGKATYSSILAWRIPWIVEARIASPGSKFSKDMRSDIHPRREKITSTASKVGKSLSKSWLILTRKEATSRVCGNF